MPETAQTANDSAPAARLEAWSRIHAALLVLSSGAAALSGRTAVLAAVSLPSFLALLWRERGRFTERAGFGAANGLTLFRFGLVLALAGAHQAFSLFECALMASVALVLDGVDGFVARKTHTASRFGAHFDMETDALFVLALTLLLWTRERLGPGILLGGLLRPAYVLWLWALPTPAGEEPRSNWGRWAFLVFALGLIAPLASPSHWADALAWCGTLAVALSFARSGRHWYRTRTRARSRSTDTPSHDPSSP